MEIPKEELNTSCTLRNRRDSHVTDQSGKDEI